MLLKSRFLPLSKSHEEGIAKHPALTYLIVDRQVPDGHDNATHIIGDGI
jgi:hypothetical protein